MERTRSALEELERIENAIADRISINPKILPDGVSLSSGSVLHGRRKRPLRDTLTTKHEISRLLDRYESQCKLLKTEQPRGDSDDNKRSDKTAFEQFDESIAQSREFYRKYPNEPVEDQAAIYKKHGLTSAFCTDLNVESLFTGEEFFGKFIDLLPFHERFLNLKFNSDENKLTYLQYLYRFTNFDNVENFPPTRLRDEDYQKYTADLQAYLEAFLVNTNPLSQPRKTIDGIKSQYKKPELEDATDHEKMYCGPCAKQFTNENVFKSHFSGKKHKKNAQAVSSGDSPVLFHEHVIKGLVEFMDKVFEQTRSNVERRRVLTDRERQAEIEQLENEAYGNQADQHYSDEDDDVTNGNDGNAENSDDEDQDESKYNPLKLPKGPDGEPIPFWLWKLHGLDTEFNCEICGNYTYMGRKAFSNHFLEPRHTQGLRALGIEPDVVYKDIASIKEVMALADRRKRQQRLQSSHEENAVEMEDEEGNVMSAKVYNDLKKQGLV